MGSNHAVILQRHVVPHKKYGKERVHREASFKSVNLTSAIRALPDSRRGHKTKPCLHQERCAGTEARDLAKSVLKLKKYGQSYVLLSY